MKPHRFILVGALMALLVAGAHAQDSTTTPTADIDNSPRSIRDVGAERPGASAKDSVMKGGSGFSLPSSSANIPTMCELDPYAFGCPMFCVANPTHSYCLPPPPPEPACVAPAPEISSIARAMGSESRDVGCPAGHTGAHQQSRSITERGEQVRNWTCPGPTGSPVSSVSETWLGSYDYGAWATTSNSCAAPAPDPTPTPDPPTPPAPDPTPDPPTPPAPDPTPDPTPPPTCSAPGPEVTSLTRPAGNDTRNAGCPAGHTGQHMQSRSRTENGQQTRSWTCPSPSGSPVSSVSTSWLGTYTYGAWSTTSNTCAEPAPPACVAPPMETFPLSRAAASETRQVACPAGQTGEHWESRSRTERGQHERTWSCPSPTGAPAASGKDVWFGTYDYGSWSTSSNTCEVTAPPTGDGSGSGLPTFPLPELTMCVNPPAQYVEKGWTCELADNQMMWICRSQMFGHEFTYEMVPCNKHD